MRAPSAWALAPPNVLPIAVRCNFGSPRLSIRFLSRVRSPYMILGLTRSGRSNVVQSALTSVLPPFEDQRRIAGTTAVTDRLKIRM